MRSCVKYPTKPDVVAVGGSGARRVEHMHLGPTAGHESWRAARARLKPSKSSRPLPERYTCTGVSCPSLVIDSCICCCAS